MSVKRKILLAIAQVVIFTLRLADRFISGSNTGATLEEELEDPYKVYKSLRKKAPMLRSYLNRGWIVLGFDEVQELW